MVFERLKHFLDTFGEPRPPRPPIIPDRYRIPFFLGLSLLSLLVLIAVVWFVVIPGTEAQRAGSRPARAVPPASQERTP